MAGLGEMAEAIRDVVQAVAIPALVDADDGYGDVKSVVRTVEVLERIGVAGILLEDQDRTVKQPEANAARSIASIESFSQKLRAALGTRRDPELVVIARTDALGSSGMDEALRRGERALELGADGIFVAGLRTPEQFERVGTAFRGQWNVAAIFEEPGRPTATPQDLHAMGFSQVVYPSAIIQRVVKTIETTLDRLAEFALRRRATLTAETGCDEISPSGFRAAVGLSRWQEIEARFAGEDDASGVPARP
jgi:2-methylisocitrate lyase-like PEP mutase family enzyme